MGEAAGVWIPMNPENMGVTIGRWGGRTGALPGLDLAAHVEEKSLEARGCFWGKLFSAPAASRITLCSPQPSAQKCGQEPL